MGIKNWTCHRAFLLFVVLLLGRIPLAQAAAGAQRRYISRAENQINSIRDGLRRAEKKQLRLRAADRDECAETLKRLWRKEKLVRTKIEAIRNAPADQWRKLRTEEDALLIHLQKNYQHLVNRYFR